MKYIDADRLRKVVKRLEKAAHKAALGCADREKRKFHEGKEFAYQRVVILIDYQLVGLLIYPLLQEQPTKGYDENYLNEKIAKASKTWENVDVDKYMDEVRGREQEQQKVELAEAVEMEWDSFNKHVAVYGVESEDVVWLNWISFVDIATYFYELGLNARKEE